MLTDNICATYCFQNSLNIQTDGHCLKIALKSMKENNGHHMSAKWNNFARIMMDFTKKQPMNKQYYIQWFPQRFEVFWWKSSFVIVSTAKNSEKPNQNVQEQPQKQQQQRVECLGHRNKNWWRSYCWWW